MKPDDNFQVFDESAEIALKEIGDYLKYKMPEGYGFSLLMFNFGKKGNMFYISNAERSDMLKAMKEFIKVQKGRK